MDEIVNCKLCAGSSVTFQFAHIIADSGQPFEPALPVKQILHLLGSHAFLRDQIKEDARIDLPGSRAHRQAVERGEAHRAFNASAVGEGAH